MGKLGWDIIFDDLILKGRFGQDKVEFRLFLQFVANFFWMRDVFDPVVVEIGTRRNRQKAFYEEFLSAEHIGIDISDRRGTPDILGDSHTQETFQALCKKIKKRNVDLLFIDGDHSYDGVRNDYFMYSPLVERGIVAVHDIACRREDVRVPLFWSKLIRSEHRYPYMTISNWCEKDRMGIGLQVRD